MTSNDPFAIKDKRAQLVLEEEATCTQVSDRLC